MDDKERITRHETETERLIRLETLLEIFIKDMAEIKKTVQTIGQCQVCESKQIKQAKTDGMKYVVAALAGAALMVKEIRLAALDVLERLFP